MKYKYLIFSTLFITVLGFNQCLNASQRQLHYLLSETTAPNSLAILPKPPTYDSVAFLNDQAQYHDGYSLKNSKRWAEAEKDADLGYPDRETAVTIARQFDKAFGTKITSQGTPAIYRILQEIKRDSSFVTKSAKKHYMRTRPFVFFHQHTCTPQDEKFLRTSGSYPSGHTTLGWATALVLAEINPSRQNQILKRGYEYGQSRVICGAHWQSDVNAGRVTGAALVARLHANKKFLDWLKTAKKELIK